MRNSLYARLFLLNKIRLCFFTVFSRKSSKNNAVFVCVKLKVLFEKCSNAHSAEQARNQKQDEIDRWKFSTFN